jgi:hypothetical protein
MRKNSMTTLEIEDALTPAIESGNVAVVREILTQHPDFINHDYGVGTWLHMAACRSNIELAETLILTFRTSPA